MPVSRSIFRKAGSRELKSSLVRGSVPAKKRYIYFCDGEVFFLDRILLMGAITLNLIITVLGFDYKH